VYRERELNVYEMENEKGKEMKVDFEKKIKCAYVLCSITSQANSNFMTIRERHFRQKTTSRWNEKNDGG